MARRRVSKAHKLAGRRRSNLRYRWKKAAGKAKYAGLRIHINKKPGRRKHHKGRGWGWTGRRGTVSLFDKVTGRLFASNPGSIVGAAKSTIITPVTSLPKSLPALLKGSVAMNLVFASGGAATAMVGGTMLQSFVFNTIAKVAPSLLPASLSSGWAQRIIGSSFALVAGGLVGRFALPSGKRSAFITGTAAAALVEAIFPGYLRAKFAELPVVGAWFAQLPASPVQGLMGMFGTDMLAAYVESPAYQGSNGMGAYVASPAYQGSNGLGAYVASPAYQGSNGLGASMDDAVAGLGIDHLALGAMGSNMPSHLDS